MDTLLSLVTGKRAKNSTWDAIQAWYAASAKNDAHKDGTHRFVPTRLLDVSEHHTPSAFENLKLITDTSKCYGGYATLSHRWGSCQHFCTSTANLESHCRGVRPGTLPKTFQDAITVTRIMGVKYLWIDAICIVQDDLQDWKHESLMMAEVYGNAAFNIAAHSAGSDEAGFLSDILFQKKRKRLWGEETTRPKITDFETLVDHSPLSSRGWVFQERILSPRILHFVNDILFWEDGRGVWAQDGSHTDCSGWRSIWKKHRIQSDWYRLMEIYSTLNLTYEKDRLHAVEGLVGQLQEWTGANYCAGMWLDSIYQGLLWRPGKTLTSSSRGAHNTLFPSWSWASCSGPILFPDKLANLVPVASGIRFTTSLDNQDTNPTKSPELTQGCLVMRAHIKCMAGLTAKFDNACETSFVLLGSLPSWSIYPPGQAKFGRRIGWLTLDEGNEPPDFSNLWCALIAIRIPMYDAVSGCMQCETDSDHLKFHIEPTSVRFLCCLILSATDVKERRFRRVGIGKFYETSWFATKDSDVAVITLE